MSALGASALMARETISTPTSSSKSINDIDIESPSPLTAAKPQLPPAPETAKKKRSSNPPSPIKRIIGRDSQDTTPVSSARLDTGRKGGFLEDTETSRQRRRDRSAGGGEVTARSDTDETITPAKGSPKKSIIEDIERARWPEALQGDGYRFHKPLAEPRAIYPLHNSKTTGISSLSSPGGVASLPADSEGNLESPSLDTSSDALQSNNNKGGGKEEFQL